MGKNAKTYYWFLTMPTMQFFWMFIMAEAPRYFSIYWIEGYKYHLQLQYMNECVMAKANEKIKTSHV